MISENIINSFNIPGNLQNIEQKTDGIINKTYIATYNENGNIKRYLVQQINDNVFKNPKELMNNIDNITAYLRNKMEELKDTKHKVLQVIKTKNGDNLYELNYNGESNFYRAYNFIENSTCYSNPETVEIVYNSGKAFGNFQKLLDDYPMDTLVETIKDFHNTKQRFKTFEQDLKTDIEKRAKEVQKEIDFVAERKNLCSKIVNKLENKEIPYRVTHNDTKVNNVMMNKDTNEFLAVVDLDTVMPGSGLYDYGDGVRSAASNAAEDETDVSKIFIKNELFEAYTDGFLSELAPYMKEEEVKLMGNSIRLMAFELGIRFLNDYINGDTYFKINYNNHNLVRARNQFKLVEDIENKLDYINSYIWNSYLKYKSL